MKSRWTFFLALPLLFSMAAFSASEKKCRFDLDEKTAEVQPGLWMSKFEVSNALYKEFLMGLIVDGRADEVPDFAPDLEVWKRDLSFNDPYTQYYLKHPAFNEYPVVGISHAAAEAFCEWMTAEYGDLVCAKANRKGSAVRYRFRLPTQSEWEMAASRSDDKISLGYYAGGFVYPRDGKGNFLFNHKLGKGNFAGVAGTDNGRDYEGYMITGPVNCFKPDGRGLYNMSGNVAEMVEEKGISKGGSWADESPACLVEAVERYTQPNAKVGFRFVVEVDNLQEVGSLD